MIYASATFGFACVPKEFFHSEVTGACTVTTDVVRCNFHGRTVVETYGGYVGLSDMILRDIVEWERYEEYSLGSLRTAETSPGNFLFIVFWIFGASEEHPVVHGAEHVDNVYRHRPPHYISSPLISI